MANTVVHFEIGCRDQLAAGAFYAGLFDWKLEPSASMTMLRTGADVGGHLNQLGHEPHNYTMFYVNVDDVAASIAKAEALGGKRLVGPIDYAPNSTFAWVADPEGNVIGLHTESKP